MPPIEICSSKLTVCSLIFTTPALIPSTNQGSLDVAVGADVHSGNELNAVGDHDFQVNPVDRYNSLFLIRHPMLDNVHSLF